MGVGVGKSVGENTCECVVNEATCRSKKKWKKKKNWKKKRRKKRDEQVEKEETR